jgi:hypothetical protein
MSSRLGEARVPNRETDGRHLNPPVPAEWLCRQ